MLLTQPGPPLTLQPKNLLQFCNCLAVTIQLHCFFILSSSPLLHKHMFYLSGWLIRCFMNQISAWCSRSICSYMRVFTVLLFQKTDGSTQTSRHYNWGDEHQSNRFKRAQTSIQDKPVCCFVRTKICIQNIKTVLRHCFFDRNLGKGLN